MKKSNVKIDLLELYAKSNSTLWNDFLSKSLARLDLNAILAVRRGIQVGMDDLVKRRLSSDKLVLFFLRLQKSLENTAKKIVRIKSPNPLDKATAKDLFGAKSDKTKRDLELEMLFKKSSF